MIKNHRSRWVFKGCNKKIVCQVEGKNLYPRLKQPLVGAYTQIFGIHWQFAYGISFRIQCKRNKFDAIGHFKFIVEAKHLFHDSGDKWKGSWWRKNQQCKCHWQDYRWSQRCYPDSGIEKAWWCAPVTPLLSNRIAQYRQFWILCRFCKKMPAKHT